MRVLDPVTELILAVTHWQAGPSEEARRTRLRAAGLAVDLDRERDHPPAVQQLAIAAQRAADAPASHHALVVEGLQEVLQVIDPESQRNAARTQWQGRADLQ
jgi:hypothetical protein